MKHKAKVAVSAAVTSALLLAACSGEDESPEQENAAPEDVSGTVTFWTYPFSTITEASWWQPYVDEFNEEYPNVEVEVVMQAWQGREESLVTAITGNNAPDVVYFNPDFVPKYADQDLLLPMDDLREDWDQFYDSSLEAMTWDDTLYGQPMLMQLQTSYCNTDVLEEAGVAACPTTWDEFRDAAPAIREAGYYATEYNGVSTLNHTFYMYLWQAGGEVLNEDMTEATFNGPEGLQALEFIQEMVDNEWVPQEPLSIAEPFEQTEAGQGNLGYVMGANLAATREFVDPDVIETVPPMSGVEQVASGSVGAWSVFNTTESPEAAQAWVRFLGEPEFLEDFLSESGYLSPRTDLDGLFADDPQIAGGSDYLEYLRTGVQHPKAREIIDMIRPHIQSVLLEGADPQEALDAAAEEVNGAL
ncbi:sugar ABC transporter substrate-binding protein [Ruania alba]|uniref:Carbohydrate ABC transporter substrate-binding protein, CUT1 family n=1 Tax=Ruania alba TaxID=648782 RepID=A0A1H5MDN6_9MICO|nr:sugar ABC transporter substrate-binding protein [Ruania alba]SEE86811.1 carbohydrate ABC transporter substrate-binding protein, CUT1 family [Ruania alba]